MRTRILWSIGLCGLCSGFGSCGTGRAAEVRHGPAGVTAIEVQSEIMSFLDTYMAVMNEAWSRAVPKPPAADADRATWAAFGNARRLSHVRRLATVSSALTIVSSPNPMVGLADLITMVSLERRGLVAGALTGGAVVFGADATKQLIRVYADQEEHLLEIARRAMTPEQLADLEGCITEWFESNPDQRYVATIRLKDHAGRRQQSESGRRASNLFTSLGLDPLASLDPAAQEVQQSRLLAERMFFYASRSPTLLRWQCELAVANMVREPAIQQTIESMASMSVAADRASVAVERLPDLIATERSRVLVEFFNGLTAQRESLSADLGRSQAALQATLVDLRATIEASDRLVTSVSATLNAAQVLADRVVAPPGSVPASAEPEPDAIEAYQAAAAQTAQTAEWLTNLTQHVERLLASPSWSQPATSMQSVVAEIEASSERMLDRVFQRLLVLTVAAPLVALLAALGYRAMTRDQRKV